MVFQLGGLTPSRIALLRTEWLHIESGGGSMRRTVVILEINSTMMDYYQGHWVLF